MDTSKIKNSYLKEFIKLKAVVHCPTEELARKVTGYADANGLKWFMGNKYSDLFTYGYSEDTCYNLAIGKHASISFYKEEGYLIIPAQEFIDKYEAAEKLENWRPKVGDVLIAIDECNILRGVKSFIIGEEYPVSGLYNDGIIISSEFDEYHHFTYDNLHKYFKPKLVNWQTRLKTYYDNLHKHFKPKPEQDRPEIKPATDAEKISSLERMIADLTDQNTRYRKELDKAVEFFKELYD